MSTIPVQFELNTGETDQLQQLRRSLSDFRAMLATLPDKQRSVDHNQQFNQFRAETKTLLGHEIGADVPRAITGNVTTDRWISLIVVGGVLVALIGFGINAVFLEDLIINSIGCLISSGGTLLVGGGLAALAYKNYQDRVNSIQELRERCDLLMLQIEHRLRMEASTYQ